ncbi:hypothetical protein [Limosilactobacillus fermentum]
MTTEGVDHENGFNEYNVGMSATESVYANANGCWPLTHSTSNPASTKT